MFYQNVVDLVGCRVVPMISVLYLRLELHQIHTETYNRWY